MHRNSAGFTFMDVMIAMVIVGVAVAAVVQSMASGTQANGRATELTVAVNLARNVHEHAMSLRINSLVAALNGNDGVPVTLPNGSQDFAPKIFSPVIDSDGKPVSGLPDWKQSVKVYYVNPKDIQTNATAVTWPDKNKQYRRLVVRVQYRNETVHTASWLLARTGL